MFFVGVSLQTILVETSPQTTLVEISLLGFGGEFRFQKSFGFSLEGFFGTNFSLKKMVEMSLQRFW